MFFFTPRPSLDFEYPYSNADLGQLRTTVLR
jgi:hypothetical protein